MVDLVVLGGGPAGSSAAITAARNGARALLLERGRFPRQKVCGEFVSAESLGLLGDLLDGKHRALLTDAIRIQRTRVFLDDRALQARVHPAAASIARLDLDDALWNSAEAAGAETRQQVTVQGVRGSGPFVVSTSAGDFETRAVVNASGRWSNLNPAPLSAGQPRWIGIKGHFEEASPPASVDLYFFDGGYCGVQPVDLRRDARHGRVNACAMVRADVASTLEEVFQQHPALLERSRQWSQLGDPVGTSPLLFREPQPERDGILRVGDAAGFVDPFVGDGISLALRSGALAAKCLVPFFRGETELADASRRYCDEYALRFGTVFQNSSKIRRLLRLPAAVRGPMVALLTKVPAVTEYLVRRTR
ncbi:MAG: NAD(P)/FAD-dependent oxidoreductase [Terriglobales bacterium]